MSDKIIGGSAFGIGDALVDVRRAVLVDGTTVVALGGLRDSGVERMLGLEITGRVNKSTERSDTLYLLSMDGVAGIVSELLGLAQRMGPAYVEQLDQLIRQRIQDLPSE